MLLFSSYMNTIQHDWSQISGTGPSDHWTGPRLGNNQKAINIYFGFAENITFSYNVISPQV